MASRRSKGKVLGPFRASDNLVLVRVLAFLRLDFPLQKNLGSSGSVLALLG